MCKGGDAFAFASKTLDRFWVTIATTMSGRRRSLQMMPLDCRHDGRDKHHRLNAFTYCMQCQDKPQLFMPSKVPTRFCLLACVLNFILSTSKDGLLSEKELTAILVSAFCPSKPTLPFRNDKKNETGAITCRSVCIGNLLSQVSSVVFVIAIRKGLKF